MSRSISHPDKEAVCFPRVSGDEPRSHGLAAVDLMFSPRERG